MLQNTAVTASPGLRPVWFGAGKGRELGAEQWHVSVFQRFPCGGEAAPNVYPAGKRRPVCGHWPGASDDDYPHPDFGDERNEGAFTVFVPACLAGAHPIAPPA